MHVGNFVFCYCDVNYCFDMNLKKKTNKIMVKKGRLHKESLQKPKPINNLCCGKRSLCSSHQTWTFAQIGVSGVSGKPVNNLFSRLDILFILHEHNSPCMTSVRFRDIPRHTTFVTLVFTLEFRACGCRQLYPAWPARSRQLTHAFLCGSQRPGPSMLDS